MDMHKTYCSLETAKKLKEAGFDVEVVGSYDIASNGAFMTSGNLKKWNYNAHEYTISAPTLEEALDWLEIVYEIKIETKLDGYEQMQGIKASYAGSPQWVVKVNELEKPEAERFGLIWESYPSEVAAIEAGIYKACQIITNNFNIEA